MERQKYDVIIIGAGAAGMTAAIFAARSGARVCVIEHRSEPGKKIMQTGNGRCNLTHESVRAKDYHCEDDTFTEKALASFGVADTIEFFASLGVPVKNKDGYIYPYSLTALSVRNALRDEMARTGVTLFTDTVATIKRDGAFFDVNAVTRRKCDGEEIVESRRLVAGKLVLATGLNAAPKTGSDGSGVELAESLGLKVNKVLPSLVKLICAGDGCKVASGVRHTSNVQLFVNGTLAAGDTGEVQFTDDGLSGIPVFNVSRFAAGAIDDGVNVTVRLDLLPDFSDDFCGEFVDKYYEQMRDRKLMAFFGGLLPAKLLTAVARGLSISAERSVAQVGKEGVRSVFVKCKDLRFDVTSCYGFDAAQVCRGGVDVGQIDPETMQVRGVPGLFVAGELIDVDGPCGGYNLQWAWTSGAVAGRIR